MFYRQGNYVSPDDERGARSILIAAFTYVATFLASLLNL